MPLYRTVKEAPLAAGGGKGREERAEEARSAFTSALHHLLLRMFRDGRRRFHITDFAVALNAARCAFVEEEADHSQQQDHDDRHYGRRNGLFHVDTTP